LKEDVGEMKTEWFQTPNGVIDKICYRHKRTITRFPGKDKIIEGKDLFNILPIINKMIVYNSFCVIKNEIITQGITENEFTI